jgi:drug/metabolite transporter (DMT)-like permease
VALADPGRPGAAGRHYLVLHLVVLIWGITAVVGKLITLDPAVLTAWRTGIAAVALGMLILIRKERWPGRRDLGVMLATGLLIGAHWFLFFLSGRLGTVSGSLVGAATLA